MFIVLIQSLKKNNNKKQKEKKPKSDHEKSDLGLPHLGGIFTKNNRICDLLVVVLLLHHLFQLRLLIKGSSDSLDLLDPLTTHVSLAISAESL